MAARNRWLASYNAIVSLEAQSNVCSRLMLPEQNSAYLYLLLQSGCSVRKLLTSLFFILIITSGCSSPHIVHNDDNKELSLVMDGKSVAQGEGDLLYSNLINLIHIKVYQNVYKMSFGRILSVEEAYADTGYVFDNSIEMLVHYIFDAYYTKQVDRIGNIFCYQLEAKKDGKKLYLFVENQNKKLLKFVYGFDKQEFDSLIVLMKTGNKDIVHNLKQSSIHKEPKFYLKSTWSHKQIVFSELVKRVGRGPKLQ